MKNILIFNCIFMFVLTLTGQNIGIGVIDPQYKLDVGGTLNLRHPSANTAGILFDGTAIPAKSFMGMIDNDRIGVYFTNSNTWPFQMNLNNGNIGIGNISPSYDLDIKGRPRIRTNGDYAGIWFDGITNVQSSLIGTFDNNHMGIWGSEGANWNFVMNVNNGNIGMGIAAPTTRLDINGNVRIRSSLPKTGSIMMSIDANGNAEWVNPIAFKATGGFDNEPNIVVDTLSDVWFKMYFNQIAAYNIGAAYAPINSEFIAPEDGIYHFEAVLDWQNLTDDSMVRIQLNRNNNISTIASNFLTNIGLPLPDYYGSAIQPSQVSADVKLMAGDKIWVEAKAYAPNAPGYSNTSTVSANNFKTWFTGNLVTRI